MATKTNNKDILLDYVIDSGLNAHIMIAKIEKLLGLENISTNPAPETLREWFIYWSARAESYSDARLAIQRTLTER